MQPAITAEKHIMRSSYFVYATILVAQFVIAQGDTFEQLQAAYNRASPSARSKAESGRGEGGIGAGGREGGERGSGNSAVDGSGWRGGIGGGSAEFALGKDRELIYASLDLKWLFNTKIRPLTQWQTWADLFGQVRSNKRTKKGRS